MVEFYCRLLYRNSLYIYNGFTNANDLFFLDYCKSTWAL